MGIFDAVPELSGDIGEPCLNGTTQIYKITGSTNYQFKAVLPQLLIEVCNPFKSPW